MNCQDPHYKFLSSLSYSFYLGQNIILSILFSNTTNDCFAYILTGFCDNFFTECTDLPRGVNSILPGAEILHIHEVHIHRTGETVKHHLKITTMCYCYQEFYSLYCNKCQLPFTSITTEIKYSNTVTK
jgi:hypothetical protein